jgi:hypothetical protein
MRFHQEWLARADDPEALAWLCATFGKALPTTGIRKSDPRHDDLRLRFAPVFERLEVLERRGPHPDIAEALTAFIEAGRFGGRTVESTMGLYGPLLELLVAQESPAHLDRIRVLAEAPRSARATVRRALAHYVEAHLGGSTAPPAPTAVAGLWEAVYAAPDDRDRKRVLADHLVEQGDVRGTYMTLVQADPHSAEAERLLRKHRKAWLGPDLAAVLTNVTFQDGFLHGAGLGANSKGDADTWARAARDPRLATLRRLGHTRAKPAYHIPFLQLPRLEAIAMGARSLAVVAARDPGLEELELWGEVSPDELAEAVGPGTSTLRYLHVRARRADSLVVARAVGELGLSRHLERLRFDGAMMVDGAYTPATEALLADGWTITREAEAYMIFARG